MFKFEEMWLEYPTCTEVIRQTWDSNTPNDEGNRVVAKLIRCRRSLTRWSKENFGNNAKELIEMKEKLRKCVRSKMSQAEVEEEMRIKSQIRDLWKREEMYWRQRSRVKWLVEGDLNTTFFHLTTTSRRQRNNICHMKGRDGRWITDEEGIDVELMHYFGKIF